LNGVTSAVKEPLKLVLAVIIRPSAIGTPRLASAPLIVIGKPTTIKALLAASLPPFCRGRIAMLTWAARG
jgi:hypothetical protein